MKHYVPDQILQDLEHSARWRQERKPKDGAYMSVPVHINVLIALIDTYREARAAQG